MASLRQNVFVEKVLKRLYANAPRGRGKRARATPAPPVKPPEKAAPQNVACQSAPPRADKGAAGGSTRVPPGRRLYTVSLPPDGILPVWPELPCGPGSQSSSSSEAEATADQDLRDQPKRRRIKKRRSKRKYENFSAISAEKSELEKQQGLSWKNLQPCHTDGPAMSKNKKRKLKKKQQIKRKKAAGLLTSKTSGMNFLYQPEEGSSEPEDEDEEDGPDPEVGTGAQEPGAFLQLRVNTKDLEPEVGTETQEPGADLQLGVGTEDQEPEVGTETWEPGADLQLGVGTEDQEPEVGTETREPGADLQLGVGTEDQEPEVGTEAQEPGADPEPEAGTEDQEPEVGTEAQEPGADPEPEAGTEDPEEGVSSTNVKADDLLTFLKQTQELCFFDATARDSELSVSMESAAQLLEHLETHGLPCSDVLVLNHMKTLLFLEDTERLRLALEMFPEHCRMPPDHARVISAFFSYWITHILPEKQANSE